MVGMKTLWCTQIHVHVFTHVCECRCVHLQQVFEQIGIGIRGSGTSPCELLEVYLVLAMMLPCSELLTITMELYGATIVLPLAHVKSHKAGTCLSVYIHICEKYDPWLALITAIGDACLLISKQLPTFSSSMSSRTKTPRAFLFFYL